MNKKFIYLKSIHRYSHHVVLATKNDNLETISVKKYDLTGLQSLALLNINYIKRIINKNHLILGMPNLIKPITRPNKIPHQFIL